MTVTCPECHGQAMPDHPCGWLAIDHVPGCSVYEADDATRANDSARLQTQPRFLRDATATERTLLTARGHALPDEFDTEVSGWPSIPTRTWPSLTDVPASTSP